MTRENNAGEEKRHRAHQNDYATVPEIELIHSGSDSVYSTTNDRSQRGGLLLEPFQRSRMISQEWGQLLEDLLVIGINPSFF